MDDLLRRRSLFSGGGGKSEVIGKDLSYLYAGKSVSGDIILSGYAENCSRIFDDAVILPKEDGSVTNIIFEDYLGVNKRDFDFAFDNLYGDNIYLKFSNDVTFNRSLSFNKKIKNLYPGFAENIDFNMRVFSDLEFFNASLDFKNSTSFNSSIVTSCPNFDLPISFGNNGYVNSYIVSNCANFNSDIYLGTNYIQEKELVTETPLFNSNIYIGDNTIIKGHLLSSLPYNSNIIIGNNVKFYSDIFYNCDFFNTNIEMGEGVHFYRRLQYSSMDSSYSRFNAIINLNKNITIGNSLEEPTSHQNGFFCNLPLYNKPITVYAGTNIYSSLIEDCDIFNSPITIDTGTKFINCLVESCNNFDRDITIPTGVTFNSLIVDCKNFSGNIILSYGVTAASNIAKGCSKFNGIVTMPTSLISCSNMFQGSLSYNRETIIPASVEDISYMFNGCWNFNSEVSIIYGVKNMSHTFDYANNFNLPIIIPDSVEDVSYCFSSADNFNQIVNFKYATNCDCAFGRTSFNSYVLFGYVEERSAAELFKDRYKRWTKEVDFNCKTLVNSFSCFENCSEYNSYINANVAGDCSRMFYSTKYGFPISLENVTNASAMFYYDSDFLPDQVIDLSNCDDFSSAFGQCGHLNNALIITNQYKSDVKAAGAFFKAGLNLSYQLTIYGVNDCTSLFDQRLYSTMPVTIDCKDSLKVMLSRAFAECEVPEVIIKVNAPESFNMSLMADSSKIQKFSLIGKDISNLKDMNHAFNNSRIIDISVETEKKLIQDYSILSVTEMFKDSSFRDLTTYMNLFEDTGNLYTGEGIFRNCSYLQYKDGTLPLKMNYIFNRCFYGCGQLKASQIIIDNFYKFHSEETLQKDAFYGCLLLNNFRINNYIYDTLYPNILGSSVGFGETGDIPSSRKVLDIYIGKQSPLYQRMMQNPMDVYNNAFDISYFRTETTADIEADNVTYHVNYTDYADSVLDYTIHFFD